MSQKKFSALPMGTLFREEGSLAVLMKLDEAREFVELTGPAGLRGQVRYKDPARPFTLVKADECLAELELAAMSAECARWTSEDTLRLGTQPKIGCAHVFAGLFVSAGFNKGTYYSARDNQKIRCTEEAAEVLARWEGLRFVSWRNFRWADDALLEKHRRGPRPAMACVPG